jgi:hypothetical protein
LAEVTATNLDARREAARARIAELELPTFRGTAGWEFTPIDKLDLDAYPAAPGGTAPSSFGLDEAPPECAIVMPLAQAAEEHDLEVLGEEIGTKTAQGIECLIRKGTDLAGYLDYTCEFSTDAEYQTAVAVTLLATDPAVEHSWRTLGKLNIKGLKPAPRGIPRIKLQIKITAAGQVDVGAREIGTGNFSRAKFERVAVRDE